MESSLGRPLPTKRILILARDREELDRLPRLLDASAPRIAAHATRRVGEALALLAEASFDAAVSSVERPGDVASVIRMRKASPRTPVLALVPPGARELSALSLQMGASAALDRPQGSSATAEILRRALEARDLAQELREKSRESLRLAGEVLDLSTRLRHLASAAVSTFAEHPAEGFRPLLVEDDPQQVELFGYALRKEGLLRRLSVARTAGEAIDYLSGRGVFSDRAQYPAPSIVILDYHLGPATGEEVLRYIRSEPSLARLPVVLFSTTIGPNEVTRMVELGVSAQVAKPLGIVGLRSAIGLIVDFWRVWRTSQTTYPGTATPASGD